MLLNDVKGFWLVIEGIELKCMKLVVKLVFVS